MTWPNGQTFRFANKFQIQISKLFTKRRVFDKQYLIVCPGPLKIGSLTTSQNITLLSNVLEKSNRFLLQASKKCLTRNVLRRGQTVKNFV